LVIFLKLGLSLLELHLLEVAFLLVGLAFSLDFIQLALVELLVEVFGFLVEFFYEDTGLFGPGVVD